ncbi:uncharacterized protein LOC114273325 isoform X2 [Camellia sinensis]|uniref:uncharacterized protein LOC114273325 isoform X2 n=1 Tax=Camellia sinensis TaxID=4442 RepID=UPI0010355FB8|nr:uncharacterized protein LOC114273325 isoform X2 [Camellia sinensis]
MIDAFNIIWNSVLRDFFKDCVLLRDSLRAVDLGQGFPLLSFILLLIRGNDYRVMIIPHEKCMANGSMVHHYRICGALVATFFACFAGGS